MKNFKKIFALGLVLTMVLVLGACDKNVSGLEGIKEKGELAVAVVKSDQKFVDALDEALEEIIEDGTYARLT